MRGWKANVVVVAIVVLAVCGIAYESKIRAFVQGMSSFSLTSLPMENMIGHKSRIQEGFRGYVVFYSDLKGCSKCLARLAYLKTVHQNYEDIGFYAILKDRDNRQRFGELMSEYEVPGDYLVDHRKTLQNRLGLGEHPMLLFFNRNGRMLASIPLDVEHDQLMRQFYRYVEEM